MKQKSQRKKMRTGLLILISVLLFNLTSYAQNRRIGGKVTGAEDAKPIPGATVKVKGTTVATPADANGDYFINAKTGDILVFSFIGYREQEVTVGTNNVINIALTNADNHLNEVVVIGYGTAKRQDLTGAVSSISASDISKSAATTFDQALQGRVAGVVISTNSGQPGGGTSVQIRGISTIGNSSEPLYVVDGVFYGGDVNSQVYTGGSPQTNPLATISPSDIESIDVLKDASAIAIYGSRGSNGVVIVTTKKGKAGAPKINFDISYGVQQLPRYLPVMDLQQYASFRNDRDKVIFSIPDPLFQDPSVLGPGTNWQKALFKNAPVQNYNVSLSGGDNRTTYILSAGYFSQDGIALKSDFKRNSIKFGLDNKTTNWLKIGTNVSASRVTENINNQDGNLIQLAIRQSPDIPVTNPDGSFGGPSSSLFTLTNPYGLTSISTNLRTRSEIYGNVYADITFLKDFVLRNEFAADYSFGQISMFTPSYQFGQYPNPNSFGSRSNTTFYQNTVRTYLSYNHTFARVYKINATLGHESVLNDQSLLNASATGYFQNTLSDLNLGDPKQATSTSGHSQSALDSYYGRFNFTYNDKYLLTSTFRYDGSSKFAPENRWNFSYAFALAYRMKQEAFLKNVDFINDLKLRLGYGLVNNQNVGNYVYGATYRTIQTGLGLNVILNQIPNPDAKWEETKSSNAGIDLSILNDRVQLTVDGYYKNTSNLLSSISLPLYSGTTPSDQFTVAQLNAPIKNIGSVTNKGIELTLNTTNIKGKNFSWTSNITLSKNANMVTSLATPTTILPQYIGTDVISQIAVGHSIGEFYGYVVEGVFANAKELNTHARPVDNSTGLPLPIDPSQIWVGDLKFKDVNNDGVINQKDLVYLGSAIPKFQYGINNTFKYKSFDLTVFFNGNYGNKIFNQLKRVNEDPQSNFGLLKSTYDYARIALINPTGSNTDVNNVYVTNPNTTVPRITTSGANNNTRPSSRYVEDGSYIRLKNLVLGYSVPYNVVQKVKLSYLRIYSNVTNLFTITKYTGYDPEVGSRFQTATSAGIDYGRYPSSRTYTFGIYAGF